MKIWCLMTVFLLITLSEKSNADDRFKDYLIISNLTDPSYCRPMKHEGFDFIGDDVLYTINIVEWMRDLTVSIMRVKGAYKYAVHRKKNEINLGYYHVVEIPFFLGESVEASLSYLLSSPNMSEKGVQYVSNNETEGPSLIYLTNGVICGYTYYRSDVGNITKSFKDLVIGLMRYANIDDSELDPVALYDLSIKINNK